MNKKDQNLFDEASQLYRAGHANEAFRYFSALSKKYPQNSDILYFLAGCLHQKGKIKDSIKIYKRSLESNPEHTHSAIGLSVLYNDIGRYDEAKKIFTQTQGRVKKGANSSPIDAHINEKFSLKHSELGDLYMVHFRYDEAIHEYQKSIKLSPSESQAKLKMAKAYAKKGMTNQAIDLLKELKRDHPQFSEARLALGLLYFGQGEIINAQKEWKLILEKDPSHQMAQMYLNLSNNAQETKV